MDRGRGDVDPLQGVLAPVDGVLEPCGWLACAVQGGDGLVEVGPDAGDGGAGSEQFPLQFGELVAGDTGTGNWAASGVCAAGGIQGGGGTEPGWGEAMPGGRGGDVLVLLWVEPEVDASFTARGAVPAIRALPTTPRALTRLAERHRHHLPPRGMSAADAARMGAEGCRRRYGSALRVNGSATGSVAGNTANPTGATSVASRRAIPRLNRPEAEAEPRYQSELGTGRKRKRKEVAAEATEPLVRQPRCAVQLRCPYPPAASAFRFSRHRTFRRARFGLARPRFADPAGSASTVLDVSTAPGRHIREPLAIPCSRRPQWSYTCLASSIFPGQSHAGAVE